MTYYLIGIKGAGVSSLACILHDLGNKVVGYDDVIDYRFTEEELIKRNIKIYNTNEFYEEGMVAIASAAFKLDHKEIVRLKDLGVTFLDYQKALGDLTREFNTISIAGTHGKTTTTSLISQLFNKVEGFGCNCFIGDGHGSANKDNKYFMIESCEFNKHFLNYSPNISIITNIEEEHMEVFKDSEDIINTYNQFIKNTKKYAVVCGDSQMCTMLDNTDKKIIYYGMGAINTLKLDVQAINFTFYSNGIKFDLIYKGKFYDSYLLPFYGKHMLQNTLAVITVCILEGFPKEKIKEHIGDYKRANRRFEERFFGNIVVVDDYAHHPSEVRATITAAVQKYPNKEVIVVFRPNTYTRTKRFYKDFASVLSLAEHSYITDIYCDREKAEDYPGVTSDLIVNGCSKSEKLDPNHLEVLLKHKDAVICFMSCKDITDLKEGYWDLLNSQIEGDL